MKCDICRGNQAIIFVQQVSKKETIELHLCESCAKQKGFTLKEKNDTSLKGLFSEILEFGNTQDQRTIKCPKCGTLKHNIKKNGIAGCEYCYSFFSNEILLFLQSEGLDFFYTGKPQENVDINIFSNKNPLFLKEQLQHAIENEDYELAAYYRDQLKKMEL